MTWYCSIAKNIKIYFESLVSGKSLTNFVFQDLKPHNYIAIVVKDLLDFINSNSGAVANAMIHGFLAS